MMRNQTQLDLFSQPNFNVVRTIKKVMNDDVRNCGHSREQIVDRMNDLAASFGVSLANGNCRQLSPETFEKWLNPNDLARMIPIKALPIFCAAVESGAALDALARPMGLRVIDAREQKLLAWAEAQMTIKKQRARMRRIEAEL